MADTVATMTIITENGEVIINASDFDPEIHKIAGMEVPVAPEEVKTAPKSKK